MDNENHNGWHEQQLLAGLEKHGWMHHNPTWHHDSEKMYKHPNGARMNVWRDHDEGNLFSPWKSIVEVRLPMDNS